ncbi:hypothetical protein J18TS1_22120 [Oceanobacillus oncorhynchi subsp. incaldanensis]|nr:hypothetical protein J18TS1_22120 [Oceanobacillus oncorhynchi subsp. incaldanensis]
MEYSKSSQEILENRLKKEYTACFGAIKHTVKGMFKVMNFFNIIYVIVSCFENNLTFVLLIL